MFSKGVRYMLMATFFFALMNVCVKLVSHLPAVEVIFFRSVVSLAMSYVAIRRQKLNIWGNNPKTLALRGIAGAGALILFFITLHNMPLATAVTVQYLSPIFTTIMGVFIVKERVKPWQWVFFALSFAGVLVVEGVDTRVSPVYLGLGVLSALLSGLAYNFIRKLNTQEHPLVIVFYFPFITLPIALLYSAFNWVQPQGWDWAILLLVGVLTQLAQYYMTMSYQAEELSKVANLNYIGIIYALVFGFILFGETFEAGAYLGMALVLLGVLLNIRYKNRLTRQQKAEALATAEVTGK
ncbi:DMT family transporter [Pontibacter ruber]|uniref:DMT family transporter n=1 Tax=Pontibacter ruber TaxID=1343895 RepID=A0ABW5D4L7_9BACT|nr:DMT family transporter [Pontibacter ruber]